MTGMSNTKIKEEIIMIINHNMRAMNAQRNMGINVGNASRSMEKLSSGLRINRAGDDAAGLSISEKMRAQIRGLDQASKNSQDGISMIQTAEGGLNETHSILQRMRELATQASNDTNVTIDRSSIKGELEELSKEITRIGQQTQFNTQNVLDGSSGTGSLTINLQVGANCGQSIAVTFSAMNADTLGVSVGASDIQVDTHANATAAISTINKAIEAVSTERSKYGAVQNRLEHTIANVDNSSENLQSAESRIRDVDMAKEMMAYSKNNILQQAAQSMLGQANQSTQGVLQLLQ
jgi:flagellin